MFRVLECLVGCSALCALSGPALASPPSLASLAAQTSIGGHPSLSLSGGPSSHVIVVDAAGGGDFVQIQPAVDAARDGDTILVRNGSYDAFRVVDKALSIVGDGSGVLISGEVRAHGLESGKVLTLVNLRVTAVANSGALSLLDDSGRVRVDRCSFLGGNGSFGDLPNGGNGASVGQCLDVAFSHCTLTGGSSANGVDGPPWRGTAGRGIAADTSSVTIHESSVTGGFGSYGVPSGQEGGNGSDGCELTQSTLYAEADQFTGGNGGNADESGPCLGALGGAAGYGLDLLGAGDLARMLRNTELGGTPGCDQLGFCFPKCYPQLPPRWGGTFVDLPGWAAYLGVPTPVRENTTLPITVRGRQGDAVYLYRSAKTRYLYLPAWESVSLVRPQRPEDVLFLGTLSGDDVPATYSLPIPDLGSGVEATTTYLQVLLVGASGTRFSGVCSLVVLDSSF